MVFWWRSRDRLCAHTFGHRCIVVSPTHFSVLINITKFPVKLFTFTEVLNAIFFIITADWGKGVPLQKVWGRWCSKGDCQGARPGEELVQGPILYITLARIYRVTEVVTRLNWVAVTDCAWQKHQINSSSRHKKMCAHAACVCVCVCVCVRELDTLTKIMNREQAPTLSINMQSPRSTITILSTSSSALISGWQARNGCASETSACTSTQSIHTTLFTATTTTSTTTTAITNIIINTI